MEADREGGLGGKMMDDTWEEKNLVTIESRKTEVIHFSLHLPPHGNGFITAFADKLCDSASDR